MPADVGRTAGAHALRGLVVSGASSRLCTSMCLQSPLCEVGCTCTSEIKLGKIAMATTKLFKNGNSQAVRIPSELAYHRWDIDLVIEREGDELRIRPAQRRMGDVLAKLARFSSDFMAEGRGENVEGEREAL